MKPLSFSIIPNSEPLTVDKSPPVIALSQPAPHKFVDVLGHIHNRIPYITDWERGGTETEDINKYVDHYYFYRGFYTSIREISSDREHIEFLQQLSILHDQLMNNAAERLVIQNARATALTLTRYPFRQGFFSDGRTRITIFELYKNGLPFYIHLRETERHIYANGAIHTYDYTYGNTHAFKLRLDLLRM